LDLDTCQLRCNPCNTTECIYQIFELSNNKLNQTLFQDDKCTQFVSEQQYLCDQCSIGPFANSSLDLQCAINSVSGQYYCNNNTCGNNNLGVSVDLDICKWTCNPCNAQECAYQKFQLLTSGLQQGLYQDYLCRNLSSSFSYPCNQCFNGDPLGNNSMHLLCGINSLSGQYYCNNNTCSTSGSATSITLDNCRWTCNPCNAGECIYQKFHLDQNVIHQAIYSDHHCQQLQEQYSYTCDKCSNPPQVANQSFVLNCAANILSGQYYCRDDKCSSSSRDVSVVLQSCRISCDPCSPSSCLFQSFQLQNNTLHQSLYEDYGCQKLGSQYEYPCDKCYTANQIANNSLTLTCNTTKNFLTGKTYCNHSNCTSSPIMSSVYLDVCLWQCNPCNPTECTYMKFHLQDNQVQQGLYADYQCQFLGVEFFYPCNQCSTPVQLVGTSLMIDCPSGTTGDITTGASNSTGQPTTSHMGSATTNSVQYLLVGITLLYSIVN